MTKRIFNLRKVIAIAICLAGVTNVVAQDYVGTYSGTLTLTPTVYLIGDPDNVNTEIENQPLQVGEHNILFPNIPIFKVGEPVNIGFLNVVFASNGDMSAPDVDGMNGAVTFSIVSGNVSGNTINCVFRMVDKATNGTQADVTFTYVGTKQTTGIKENVTDDKKIIVGYYSITGQKLNKEPESGLYIVVYDNGKSEKMMKK